MDLKTLYLLLKSDDNKDVSKALRFIYKSWHPQVNGALVKMGCKEKDDFLSCFNEGFLALRKNALKQKISATTFPELKSYFISICKNYWLNKYELNPMKNKLVEEQAGLAIAEEEPSFKSMEPKVQSLVRQLLGSITERCKERILYSKYFSADQKKIDISAEEIAGEMNYSSPRAATKALNKCLEQLRARVAEEIKQRPELKTFLLEQLGISMKLTSIFCLLTASCNWLTL